MKASVYIETSVISYLVSQPSRDLIVAGHQQITHEWWAHRRQRFDCFISEAVRKEAEAGEPVEAQKRIDAMRDIWRFSKFPMRHSTWRGTFLIGALYLFNLPRTHYTWPLLQRPPWTFLSLGTVRTSRTHRLRRSWLICVESEG